MTCFILLLITSVKAFRKSAKNSSRRTEQLAEDTDNEQISAIANSGNNMEKKSSSFF
jgi:hypothetical protein